jgi:hypothetical protein
MSLCLSRSGGSCTTSKARRSRGRRGNGRPQPSAADRRWSRTPDARYLQRLTAAHALQFAIFNHPQQLFLYQHRRCRQLIQKQFHRRRAQSVPDDACWPGKGAGFMAKQFAVEQIFIQRRAVKG